MWPSLGQAPSPPCDLLLNGFSKRCLMWAGAGGKHQRSRREPTSVPCPARSRGSVSDVAGGTSGAEEESASSLPFAGCVGGTRSEPSCAASLGGSPTALVSFLSVTCLR